MRMSLSAGLRSRQDEREKYRIQPGDRAATVIAVAAQKGGVGKTTTTVSLASALARFHGKKVLVVDLDGQAQASYALRHVVQAGGGALSDVLADRLHLEVEEVVTTTQIPGLFVTPGDIDLQRAEDRMAGRIGKELTLRKALQVTRTHYDIILLDCAPNVGTLTVNGLAAADKVLIPCNPTALAVAGVTGILEAVDEVKTHLNPELDVMGLVLTRVDARNSRTNAAVMELVEGSFGAMLMPEQVGVSNSLAEAQLEGRDIFDVAPTSRGALHYRALAEAVLARI